MPTKKASSRKPVKFSDFTPSRPRQLALWELHQQDALQRSHLADLYDAIPKYHYGKAERVDGQFLPPLDRSFVHKDIMYRAVVSPAKLEQQPGNFVDHYPSVREELVEDALRKLACTGQGVFLRDDKGVDLISCVFTLYQLQQELKSTEHTYDTAQIKESLEISAKANIDLRDASGKAVLISSIFPSVGLTSREDFSEDGRGTKCFVRFHPLVTKSVVDKTFRKFNYEISMKYRRALARWLHKRLSANFLQASTSEVYNIKLSTILRDSNMKQYRQIRDNVRDVKLALDEMVDAGVLQKNNIRGEIEGYKVKLTYSDKRKNKIMDAIFYLCVSHDFVSEMIDANRKHRVIEMGTVPYD